MPERRWYDIILRKKERKKEIGFIVALTQAGLVIQNILRESPAYLAGIREGAVIVSINGECTRFMSLTEARRKIYNVYRKELKLEVQRQLYLVR